MCQNPVTSFTIPVFSHVPRSPNITSFEYRRISPVPSEGSPPQHSTLLKEVVDLDVSLGRFVILLYMFLCSRPLQNVTCTWSSPKTWQKVIWNDWSDSIGYIHSPPPTPSTYLHYDPTPTCPWTRIRRNNRGFSPWKGISESFGNFLKFFKLH